MITQTRGTNTTTNSNDRPEATSQAGRQVSQGVRERPVERSRESGRQTGSNVQRYGGVSPALGGTASPFAMMRRMSEEMDRLFEHFGFPRTSTALAPRFGAWLDDDLLTGGRYRVDLDASTLPDGVYYCILDAGKFRAVERIVVVK